jgi:hypothetical protein
MQPMIIVSRPIQEFMRGFRVRLSKEKIQARSLLEGSDTVLYLAHQPWPKQALLEAGGSW